MQAPSPRFVLAIALMSGTLFVASGCRHKGDPYNMSGNMASWNASKTTARQQLTEIPAATKGEYLAINQESQWQNPFLTVESNMIQIRIYLADENSSPVDRGGLTRLSSARKHILNVRLKDLPRALSVLPDGAWPYGRIVGINTELEAPRYQTRLRKNLAITIAALKDMGIAVDDFTGRGPS